MKRYAIPLFSIHLFSAIFIIAATTSQVCATIIDIDFDSLPSTQGWTYLGSAQENTVSSLSGGILSMNTLGVGFGPNNGGGAYAQIGVFNMNPFTLSVRARVLVEDIYAFNPAQAFTFSPVGNNQAFSIALGTDHIALGNNGALLLVDFDNTQFHDYVLQGTPGIGQYKLTVDNSVVFYGYTESNPNNYLYLGDGSSTANAHAEITRYTFQQADPVPEPATMLLFGTGIAGFGRHKTQKKKVVNTKAGP